MSPRILQGELVRLAAYHPDTDSDPDARWSRDSMYWRFLSTEPARPWTAKQVKEEWEKSEIKNDNYFFTIRTLADDRLIGGIGFDEVIWPHRDCFIGIGIGDREFWGKGYGTDAMRVMLRFGFEELDLHRVSLTVFEYNERAIRSYEKLGFVSEGKLRQYLNRDGRRWDMFFMGLLREEWEKQAVRS